MENSVVVQLTRGQKISAALKGKNWSEQRKAEHALTMQAGKELYEKTGGKEGFKAGRPKGSVKKV